MPYIERNNGYDWVDFASFTEDEWEDYERSNGEWSLLKVQLMQGSMAWDKRTHTYRPCITVELPNE